MPDKCLQAQLFALAHFQAATPADELADRLCQVAALAKVPREELPDEPVALALFVREFLDRAARSIEIASLMD